jgi:hypothetical protein
LRPSSLRSGPRRLRHAVRGRRPLVNQWSAPRWRRHLASLPNTLPGRSGRAFPSLPALPPFLPSFLPPLPELRVSPLTSLSLQVAHSNSHCGTGPVLSSHWAPHSLLALPEPHVDSHRAPVADYRQSLFAAARGVPPAGRCPPMGSTLLYSTLLFPTLPYSTPLHSTRTDPTALSSPQPVPASLKESFRSPLLPSARTTHSPLSLPELLALDLDHNHNDDNNNDGPGRRLQMPSPFHSQHLSLARSPRFTVTSSRFTVVYSSLSPRQPVVDLFRHLLAPRVSPLAPTNPPLFGRHPARLPGCVAARLCDSAATSLGGSAAAWLRRCASASAPAPAALVRVRSPSSARARPSRTYASTLSALCPLPAAPPVPAPPAPPAVSPPFLPFTSASPRVASSLPRRVLDRVIYIFLLSLL